MAGRRITLLDDDQWPGEGFGTEMRIAPATAALGIIDVQHYFFDSQSDAAGVLGRHHPELQREVERRTGAMIGNIAALQEAFRGGGNRLFYTRHGMLLADGAEMIERRRERERAARASTGGKAGHMPVKGERGHDILSAVAPLKSELIWDKNDADRGFNVIVVSDACETLDAGSAEAAQILFGRIWGYVMTTADVLEWLRTGEPPAQTRRPAPPD